MGPSLVPVALLLSGDLAVLPTVRNTSSAARIRASTSARAFRSRSAVRCRRPDPVVASDSELRARPLLPVRAPHRLLQRPVHGVLHPGAGAGSRHRPVPHLFPASIAIGYGLDGLTGARQATPARGRSLGVLAVYFAGRAMFGRAAGRRRRPGLLALNVIRGVVRALPERRGRDAGAAVLGAARRRSRAHVDGDIGSSRRWRGGCSASCSSCASTRVLGMRRRARRPRVDRRRRRTSCAGPS